MNLFQIFILPVVVICEKLNWLCGSEVYALNELCGAHWFNFFLFVLLLFFSSLYQSHSDTMYVNMTAIQADVLVSNKVNIPGGKKIKNIKRKIFSLSLYSLCLCGNEGNYTQQNPATRPPQKYIRPPYPTPVLPLKSNLFI